MGENRLYTVLEIEWRALHSLVLVHIKCEERLRQIFVPILELMMFFRRDALEALDELVIQPLHLAVRLGVPR